MSTQQPVAANPDDKAWWEHLYQTRTTPWELNAAAPPFRTFLQSPYAKPPGKMVVPGCGTGSECLLFASAGYEVTGVDFAPSAIQATMHKFSQAGLLGNKGFVLQRDFFDIHEYDDYFDYVLEHTCFCAIHPSRRRTYVRTIRDLLKPGGYLIGLWWILETKGGPPFSLTKNDIFDLFGKYFEIELAFEPSDSVPERRGRELFAIMRMT
jgi:SAM-dependent methyltransferase